MAEDTGHTQTAPKGNRLLIALAGRRNVGKSSLLNAIIGQEVSIVSDVAGTTTDAVVKHYELLPFGPVTFYDTAGFDDEGDLGKKRIAATDKVLWRTDMVLLVTDETGLGEFEQNLLSRLKSLQIPYLIVRNKADKAPLKSLPQEGEGIDISVSSLTGEGIEALKELIIRNVPESFKNKKTLLAGLVRQEETVACIAPIDSSAPAGRLILPQVQVIREILDNHAYALVSQSVTPELLNRKPDLIITDSQALKEVAAAVPDNIPLTTFSLLFARFKGELASLVKGAETISRLQPDDEVLIAEACSHHAQGDDIGRVKIPNLIRALTGHELKFSFSSGHDFPADLERYSLVVHCGGCMLGQLEMLRRIHECERRGVPITNYGMAISTALGVLPRVLKPFAGEF